MKDNNRRHDNTSEPAISKKVKDIKIIPSEELKEKTFQSMLSEVEHARKQQKRRKRKGGGFKFGAVATIVAAALLFILFAGEMNLDLNLSGEKGEHEQRGKIINGVDYEKTTRAESKEFVLYEEGGGERNVSYSLLDKEYFPFSTYMPNKGWREETIQTEDRNGLKLVRDDNPANYIEIVFFLDGTGEIEAKSSYSKRLDQFAAEENEASEYTQGAAKWAISTHIITGNMSGLSSFGKYGDNYFYMIYPTLPDGSERPVLDEWQWKDTGQPLND